MNINTALARIITRYVSGALTSIGLSDAIVTSPDAQSLITMAVGVVLGAVTESLYAYAKRSGGSL